jgi:hypothetical protein
LTVEKLIITKPPSSGFFYGQKNMIDKRETPWTTYFSTVATALILAAILFTGRALYDFGNKLTELNVTSNYTSKQIEMLTNQVRDNQANTVNRADFVELRERVRALERGAAAR